MTIPIQLKRSSVGGKIPLTTDLMDGELSANTVDGKLYIKKTVAAVDTILRIGPVDSVAGRVGDIILASVDVGLGNVNNTSDANKPVSTAQQAALATKASSGGNSDITSLAGLTTAITVAQGGTGATSAAAGLAALGGVPASALGSTVATLVAGTVPASQLPSYVDDVVEAATLALFPATGESGKIYIAINSGALASDPTKQYRWSGSAYVNIPSSPGSTDNVPEGATNLYFTNARSIAAPLTGLSTATATAVVATDSTIVGFGKAQAQITGLTTSVSAKAAKGANSDITSLSGLTTALSPAQGGTGVATLAALKAAIGVDQVTNTSDANKPVSTAQATAISSKAALGANSDITSISGLTTALSPAQGGTGVVSLDALKTAIALDQVNNTTDVNKPVSTAQAAAIALKVNTSLLGTASGVATLDASGKLLAAQIPTALLGAVVYQGTWNASTNVPALASGVGTKGFYYKVSTAGATAVDGISQWNIGDTIIFDGTTWDKLNGISSQVVTVFGRTGAVVLTAADVVSALTTIDGGAY